jgi:endonuclease-3
MPETLKIIEVLKERYPDAECSLRYSGEPWKLLVLARLSAQCTDARVNIVGVELFKRYPTADALADADIADVERIVRPCGLYHVKAADIIAECAALRDRYNGEVPRGMDELLSLPGVGRKIANLIRGDVFGEPGIVADTHCIRICGRLGYYPESMKDPAKVERILSAVIPPDEQADFCHRLVLFGRDICTARSPDCANCPLTALCAHTKTQANQTVTNSI